MDSLLGRAAPRPGETDSPNLQVIKEVYRAVVEEGVEAGVESLVAHAHADFQFRPYTSGDRVLRGPDEILAFFRDRLAEGTSMTIRPHSFQELGDEVVVDGAIRLARPGGGFAETQLSWTYRFRDGRLTEAHWGPRQP
jgi:ketosteroid isomerase-like protein